MNLQHTHDLFWHLIALQWIPSSLFCVSVPGFVSFNLFSPWHTLPISLPPVPPVPTRIRSHLLHLLLSQPAHFFPSAGDVERSLRGVRDPVSWAPSLLSDGPQSQSLTLSGAEVYTHGKLIPMPCLPHIAVVSKEVRCVVAGVTFPKDKHAVGSHYAEKQHMQWMQWKSGWPNEKRGSE